MGRFYWRNEIRNRPKHYRPLRYAVLLFENLKTFVNNNIVKYQKLTLASQFFTLVFPENVTITTPVIPKVEMTTKSFNSIDESKEIPSGHSAGNRNNKRSCMTEN